MQWTLRCGEELVLFDNQTNADVPVAVFVFDECAPLGPTITVGATVRTMPKGGGVLAVAVPPSTQVRVTCPGAGDGNCTVRMETI